MKNIKINSFKLFLTALSVSSILLVSCDNVKKSTENSTEDAEEIVEVERDNLMVDTVDNVIKTRTYIMKAGTPIVYNLDANGIAGFDDWADYTIVNYELADIRRANYITSFQRVRNMNYRIANLGNTIPAWLKTEEVMEGVADIQKEYAKIIKEDGASENEMRENLEELSEKFDDLKKELDKTVAEYVKIHEDAIEEFNEEIKKGKIDAALKEYNEELKKLDNIVEKEQ